MTHALQQLFILILFIAIQACTPVNEQAEDNEDNNNNAIIEVSNLSSIKLVDASRQALAGAEITIARAQNSLNKADNSSTILQSNADGYIQFAELIPGNYILTISTLNSDGSTRVSSVVRLNIGNQNQNNAIEIIAPLSQNPAGDWIDLSQSAIIATISGVVNDGNNPVVGAEVSLSGGSATNGSVITSFTDALGHYDLNINMADSFAAAMSNASLIVTKEGYDTLIEVGIQVYANTANSGVNLNLNANLAADALFRETFETDSTTLSDWTVKKINGDNVNNTWNLYNADNNIVNQAYTNGLVKLAPNDNSFGQILAPSEGVDAFWYGSLVAADGININGSVQGNFLGNEASDFTSTADGGTSIINNGSELISPLIDFTNISSETPLSLTFQNWWEIESVNPNANGFDVMTIALSTDSGQNFTPIARLNPLSDPQDLVDRSSLPFSNTGYNNAPKWSWQENIPLQNAQGKVIQLKFIFSSEDELFNGFRGWMIDDVQIQQVQGSFPIFDATLFDISVDDGNGNGSGVIDVISDFLYFDYETTILPAAYDANNSSAIALSIGEQQNFSATLITASNKNGSLHLVLRSFDPDDSTIYTDTAAFASLDFTAAVEGRYALSGAITIPNTDNPLIQLFAVMLDADGNFLYESYLETYQIQPLIPVTKKSPIKIKKVP